MTKILIVDDEPDMEILMQQHFRHEISSKFYEFLFVNSASKAMNLLERDDTVDIVISDINMPQIDGLTFLKNVKQTYPHIETIVVSAYGDMENIRLAMNYGVFDFITKPINFKDLDTTLMRALVHSQTFRSAMDAQAKLLSVNQELKVASHIQQTVLPKNFHISDDIDLHGIMIPATEVGGDFYDFFWLNDEELGVVIADVSGKGITGAFFMAITRTQLKSLAAYTKTPSECLQKLNTELYKDNDTMMFVTVFYGILNCKTGAFRYANAGHCDPVYIKKDGSTNFIDHSLGIAIGVTEDAKFEEGFIQFSPGDMIVLYTDGINEATNANLEEFGNTRLLDSLSHVDGLSVEQTIQRVVQNIKEFTGQAPQSDDLTCLSIRWLPNEVIQ